MKRRFLQSPIKKYLLIRVERIWTKFGCNAGLNYEEVEPVAK